MNIPDFLTWDGDPLNSVPPYRPGVADMGGDELEDDIEDPPDPDLDPTAGGWNQKVKQIPALARVAPSCRVYVKFSAGVPAVYQVVACGTSVTTATFTVSDVGPGIVLITPTAAAFPGRRFPPGGLSIIAADAPAGVRWGQFEVIGEAVKIRLYEGTTPADLDCSFDWD